jgi:Fur family ferric uptake transcriptional regulator/Fur family zinc uptake transcriptional regulator
LHYEMDAKNLLRSVGLRRTKIREVVLSLLRSADRPLTHQEVAASREASGVDRVTLYRTLAALQRAGLLHRVQGTDGAWRFCLHESESAGCPGNHVHFLCLECGGMTCLADQPLPWVAVPAGARVTGKQLVVHGVCAGCAHD